MAPTIRFPLWHPPKAMYGTHYPLSAMTPSKDYVWHPLSALRYDTLQRLCTYYPLFTTLVVCDNNHNMLSKEKREQIKAKQKKEPKRVSLLNPNCCSRRIPINTRLSMLASRCITPACNQMQVTSLHPWCWCTTLFHSSPPSFSNLKRWKKKKKKCWNILVNKFFPSICIFKIWSQKFNQDLNCNNLVF